MDWLLMLHDGLQAKDSGCEGICCGFGCSIVCALDLFVVAVALHRLGGYVQELWRTK